MLAGLFAKYACDKGRLHHYERFYGRIPTPTRMLEVGILRGESLRAWRQFWPEAHIVAIDTFQRVKPERVAELDKVEWYEHDSRELFAPRGFDLIIDDGNHSYESQAKTFTNLIRNVAPGGRYVIEDVWPWDRMSAADKANPWAPGISEEGWALLLDALSGYKVTFHDLRKGHCPDSFLIEVRRK